MGNYIVRKDDDFRVYLGARFFNFTVLKADDICRLYDVTKADLILLCARNGIRPKAKNLRHYDNPRDHYFSTQDVVKMFPDTIDEFLMNVYKMERISYPRNGDHDE